jgi:hypothetical protein
LRATPTIPICSASGEETEGRKFLKAREFCRFLLLSHLSLLFFVEISDAKASRLASFLRHMISESMNLGLKVEVTYKLF